MQMLLLLLLLSPPLSLSSSTRPSIRETKTRHEHDTNEYNDKTSKTFTLASQQLRWSVRCQLFHHHRRRSPTAAAGQSSALLVVAGRTRAGLSTLVGGGVGARARPLLDPRPTGGQTGPGSPLRPAAVTCRCTQFIYTYGRAVFQRFASTDAKHYVFCVNGTKNAYSITQN